MSKTWYPIINDENCVECGACFDKCSHNVFKRKRANRSLLTRKDVLRAATAVRAYAPVKRLLTLAKKKVLKPAAADVAVAINFIHKHGLPIWQPMLFKNTCVN